MQIFLSIFIQIITVYLKHSQNVETVLCKQAFNCSIFIADDLEINPHHIEKMIRDFTDAIKQTEQDKENILNDLQSTESRVSHLQNEVKSLQQKLDEGDRALQANERAKERIELQFERTQETIRLQVSLRPND